MPRDVTIRGTPTEMLGDETVEVWLKRGSAEWELYDVVDVVDDPTQDFLLENLEEAVLHVLQLRATRESRYRTAYLSADPDDWPVQSRYQFTPGLDLEFGVPAITGTEWERTSGSAQEIRVTATAASGSEAYALQLLRNGSIVDEIAGPHGGPVVLTDANPPLAADHSYTVRHVEGFDVGPQTGAAVQYAGPAAPVNLAHTTPGVGWYAYTLEWDAPPSGAVSRVQDNYANQSVFAARTVTAADATTSGSINLEKNSSFEPNGNSPCLFDARVRHEVTAFAVTDVSKWVEVEVLAEIASDETAWDERPIPF